MHAASDRDPLPPQKLDVCACDHPYMTRGGARIAVRIAPKQRAHLDAPATSVAVLHQHRGLLLDAAEAAVASGGAASATVTGETKSEASSETSLREQLEEEFSVRSDEMERRVKEAEEKG